MKTKKIDALTRSQQDKFPNYVEKWLSIGLDYTPLNKEECKKLAVKIYKNEGLKEPKEFHFVDSPIPAIDLMSEKYGVGKRDAFNNFIHGNHTAGHLSFYDFFHNETDVHSLDPILPHIELTKHCGWWLAYESVCVFVEKPIEIVQNDAKELSNEEGPAILYKDGYKVWAINGITLNEQIVMYPETLTRKQIEAERNNDVQSIMIDRFGWPRYLQESKAKELDTCENVIENTIEALYETENHANKLLVTCPTGRMFALSIPSEYKTCSGARGWYHSDEEGKYNILART